MEQPTLFNMNCECSDEIVGEWEDWLTWELIDNEFKTTRLCRYCNKPVRENGKSS